MNAEKKYALHEALRDLVQQLLTTKRKRTNEKKNSMQLTDCSKTKLHHHHHHRRHYQHSWRLTACLQSRIAFAFVWGFCVRSVCVCVCVLYHVSFEGILKIVNGWPQTNATFTKCTLQEVVLQKQNTKFYLFIIKIFLAKEYKSFYRFVHKKKDTLQVPETYQ